MKLPKCWKFFQVGVFLDGSCPSGNFPGGSFPGWELSGWEFFWWGFSWVGIVQVGLILSGNFLWRKFSGWELSGGNHPGGNFPGGSFHVSNLERLHRRKYETVDSFKKTVLFHSNFSTFDIKIEFWTLKPLLKNLVLFWEIYPALPSGLIYYGPLFQ